MLLDQTQFFFSLHCNTYRRNYIQHILLLYTALSIFAKEKNARAWNSLIIRASSLFVFVINLSISFNSSMRYYTTTAIAAAATTEFLAFDSWALFFPLNSALVGSLRALNFFHFFIFVFLLFFVIFRVFFSCCHRSYSCWFITRENVISFPYTSQRILASLDMHFFSFFLESTFFK